jgi:hypothetical protein
MDIVSERFEHTPDVSDGEVSLDFREVFASRYPNKEDSALLTPSQTLQRLQELYAEDQSERTDAETFAKKVQREHETGVDEDALRRQEFAVLIQNGSIDTFLQDAQVPDKDKSFALKAAWLLFQHSGEMEDLSVAMQLACERVNYMSGEGRTSNLESSIDRYLIQYQLQRHQLADVGSAVQIFGTNSFAARDSELTANPLADKAEDLKRLFAQNPQHFAARILSIFS